MKDVSENIRKLIVSHYKDNCSIREIARHVNRPKSTVANIIKHYRSYLHIISRRVGRCGRPRKLSVRMERALGRASIAKPQATAREIQGIVQGAAAFVSLNTVKRSLQRQGRMAYRPLKSPNLTAAQKRSRFQWCLAHQSWTLDNWNKVSDCELFSKNHLLNRAFCYFSVAGSLLGRNLRRCW